MITSLSPKVFRCTAFVHHYHSKLNPKSLKCVFVGYSPTQGYKCYYPNTKNFFMSCDVSFIENHYYYSTIPLHEEIPSAKQSRDDRDVVVFPEFPETVTSITPIPNYVTNQGGEQQQEIPEIPKS